MNHSEILELMALIRLRYPKNDVIPASDEAEETLVAAAKTWEMTLDDVSAEDASAALLRWFKTQKWAPDPSELRMLALDLDGARTRRISDLRRWQDAGTISPEARRELTDLENGAPLLREKALPEHVAMEQVQ